MLLMSRRTIQDETAAPTRLATSLAFLYRDFKPGLFLWEFVDVFARKVLLVGFFSLLRPGSVAQLIAAALLALLLLFAQAIAQPYRLPTDFALAICCDFCLVWLCWFDRSCCMFSSSSGDRSSVSCIFKDKHFIGGDKL